MSGKPSMLTIHHPKKIYMIYFRLNKNYKIKSRNLGLLREKVAKNLYSSDSYKYICIVGSMKSGNNREILLFDKY